MTEAVLVNTVSNESFTLVVSIDSPKIGFVVSKVSTVTLDTVATEESAVY